MANILDQIINHEEIKPNDNQLEKKPTSEFISNLDDLDDNFGLIKIKVIGIGGAGCNVINHINQNIKLQDNVKLYAFNTDVGALRKLQGCCNCFLLGKKTLRGAGSGGDPRVGKSAAIDDLATIGEIIKDTDLLILIAGLGKGTGSGATPEIAKLAKNMGITTISIVNLPSIQAEGQKVYRNSINNFKEIVANSNSYCSISNDKIIQVAHDELTLFGAFKRANQEVGNLVSMICETINHPTQVNIDFADVKNFFTNAKVFMPLSFKINSENYNYDNLFKIISSTIKNSYCNVPLTDANNVLANVKLPINTTRNIITDIKTVFNQLTQNNELWLTNGIDENTIDDQIIVDILVASNIADDQVLNGYNEEEFNDYQKARQRVFVNNDELNEFINHNHQEQKEVNKDKQIFSGLKTSSYLNEESLEEENKSDTVHHTVKLDSQSYTDLLTKAIKPGFKKPKVEN